MASSHQKLLCVEKNQCSFSWHWAVASRGNQKLHPSLSRSKISIFLTRYWEHRDVERVFRKLERPSFGIMKSILDNLNRDGEFCLQSCLVLMASQHDIWSIIARYYGKVGVLHLIYTHNVNWVNENWRFVINFWFLISNDGCKLSA